MELARRGKEKSGSGRSLLTPLVYLALLEEHPCWSNPGASQRDSLGEDAPAVRPEESAMSEEKKPGIRKIKAAGAMKKLMADYFLELDDERHPRFDRRYAGVAPENLPATESLKITLERVLPYWHMVLAPAIKSGQRLLVAAHGNSLRAMVKYLDNISDEEIPGLNIPTGVPLVYELDDDLKRLNSYYLGDPNEIAKKAAAVAAQGKAK